MTFHFEIYEHRGLHHWRVKSGNGTGLARSCKGYKTHRGLMRVVRELFPWVPRERMLPHFVHETGGTDGTED